MSDPNIRSVRQESPPLRPGRHTLVVRGEHLEDAAAVEIRYEDEEGVPQRIELDRKDFEYRRGDRARGGAGLWITFELSGGGVKPVDTEELEVTVTNSSGAGNGQYP